MRRRRLVLPIRACERGVERALGHREPQRGEPAAQHCLRGVLRGAERLSIGDLRDERLGGAVRTGQATLHGIAHRRHADRDAAPDVPATAAAAPDPATSEPERDPQPAPADLHPPAEMNRAIPLRSGIPLVERVFRQIIDRGHRRPPWADLDPSRGNEADREIAMRAWASRANAEYLSMALFAELSARAAEIGMPLEITCGLSRLVQDEARHSELCARVSSALGGTEAIALPSEELSFRALSAPHTGSVSSTLGFARWVLGMFCVGEASSVALLDAMTKVAADDPCIAVVLETLHQDEVLHDRFGWAVAEMLVPTFNEEERDWLGSELAQALAFYEKLHAPDWLVSTSSELPPPEGERGLRMGMLTSVEHARVFYERVERAILPRLDHLGIGAWEAWSLRRDVPVTIRPV